MNWDSLGTDVMKRKPEKGESLSELRNRVTSFVKKIYQEFRNDNVLFVTHAGVIRQLISYYSRLPSLYVFLNIPIEHGKVFEIQITGETTGKVMGFEKGETN